MPKVRQLLPGVAGTQAEVDPSLCPCAIYVSLRRYRFLFCVQQRSRSVSERTWSAFQFWAFSKNVSGWVLWGFIKQKYAGLFQGRCSCRERWLWVRERARERERPASCSPACPQAWPCSQQLHRGWSVEAPATFYPRSAQLPGVRFTCSESHQAAAG